MLEALPASGHNDALVGDTLTTLTLNYQWRKWIGGLLDAYINKQYFKLSQAQFDTLSDAYALLTEDLYD